MAMICRLQPSSYLTFSTEVWQLCNAWVLILSFLWDMFMLRDVQYQKNSLVQLQQFLFLDPMILNFCLFAQPRRLKAVPPPYNLAPLGRTEQEKSAQFLCLNVFPRKTVTKESFPAYFVTILQSNSIECVWGKCDNWSLSNHRHVFL